MTNREDNMKIKELITLEKYIENRLANESIDDLKQIAEESLTYWYQDFSEEELNELGITNQQASKQKG